jgi:SAM-dependent methyltransferase
VQPGFIEEYIQGIETYLKMKCKDRIIRGQADQLSGNLIIEFEKELLSKGKINEAEGQLRKYTACVWSQEKPDKRTKFICLATDGRCFRAYTPIAAGEPQQSIEPEGIRLNLLEDVDASRLKWDEFYFFLDRYLLRKEMLAPTSEHIIKDFGPNSHAFQVCDAALLGQWNKLRDRSDYGVLYDAWEKYLRIVYGSSIADQELFVRHTYLATLAKLMVWSRFPVSQGYPAERDIVSILEGTYFKERLGIENFLEEDFFSWVARDEAKQTTIEIVGPILALLRNYNLREISEDVLKSLYEGLVDPDTRHDLGEYYTPDWLADRIVRKMLGPNPKANVLDPACGSGTFLYMAIREKRRLLKDSVGTLKHICDAVVGMDIHPLACIIAKANYVLALGDLMVRRRVKTTIPVYLSNSIHPPELETAREFWQKVECYKTSVSDRYVYIPALLMNDPVKYDQAVEAAREFAVHSIGSNIDSVAFERFLKTNYRGLVDSPDAVRVLCSVAETLKGMIETGRDTIWAFILKNIYKPLFLKERFDLVVGNPPWLSYRYVERSDYQKFLKEQITKEYGLVSGRAELITHLELGTLFLVRSADLYLKPKGKIGFVLPKSIFSADQHDVLRRGQVVRGGEVKTLNVSPIELWDLEQVSPLFKTSAAVYIGEKVQSKTEGAIRGEVIRGELSVRNAGRDAAEKALASQDVAFNLSTIGKCSFWSTGDKVEIKESSYRKLFRQGATIVPRCFWFVDIRSSELGFDENLPPLVSSQRAQHKAKKEYKNCVIEETVESRFIFATLMPEDMVPFGVLRFRPIVLPVERSRDGIKLLIADQARSNGFVHLAEWIDKVQAEWIQRGGRKAKEIDAIGWLNYRNKLSQQDEHEQYKIIYATSGTHICACTVSVDDISKALTTILTPKDFFVDCTTYYLASPSRLESHYLSAILNTPCVNKTIKDMQAKGLWGARHIHKKVLDLPIPRFNEKSKQHHRLAEIGEGCAEKVRKWIESGGPGNIKSIGVLRRRVRELLSRELAEIDSIVKPMLGL